MFNNAGEGRLLLSPTLFYWLKGGEAMAEKINATCAICGKGYHLCMSCKDMISLTPWKKHTDTSEHYKIYQIIHGYSTKVYTKAEAKAKLKKVDLSDFDMLRDNIKAVITDIMGADVTTPAKKVTRTRKPKTVAKPVVEPVISDPDVADEVSAEQ
jgi:hypothetical protein